MAITLRHDTISRRGFLAGSSALAVGAGLATAALGPERPARRPRQPSEAAWRQLADKISGPVLRAASFNLAQIARPYNLRYVADLPDAIALCRTPEDVAYAITWCNENRFPLVVQAAGHSYAGFSMRKGGLMINLLLMRSAKIAGDRRDGGGRHAQPGSLLPARAEQRGHHARPLPDGRRRRLPARRRHRLQHAQPWPRLRPAGRKPDRHRRRPDQDHRAAGERDRRRALLGLPRRRRGKFRGQHVVHAAHLPGRAPHRLPADLDGGDAATRTGSRWR